MRSIFRLSILGLCLFTFCCSFAHEGMWLPTLLQAIEGDMRTEGLVLSAEDIYSINHGSLKDAVVVFGGGCTAEMISEQGLILTNHHCGFSAVQDHSSLEHDYLKNGFYATDPAGELMNEGLTVTFIVRMEDVTERVLSGVNAGMSEADRAAAVTKASEALAAEAKQGNGYNAVVRPFNYGNSYFLIVSETFRDIRLVCAPPSAIGKFGGDTDNWMWPRHTGDFSIFRIYAGKDNGPADASLENVPYHPKHSLPIAMDGVKAGDFDMIYGFPGQTQRYLSSFAVDYVVNTGDPLRIHMRDASLSVIDAAMRSSDLRRIQYADKQSGISNSWKKWIGEVRGLKELGTVEHKRAFEQEYRKRAAGRAEYIAPLDALAAAYQEFPRYAKARDLFSEFMNGGSELMRFSDSFKGLINGYDDLKATGKLDAEIQRLQHAIDAIYKDLDIQVDKDILKAQLPIHRANTDAASDPDVLQRIEVRFKGSTAAFVDDLYARSLFTDVVRLRKALTDLSPKGVARLKKDPMFELSQSCYAAYNERVKPKLAELNDRIAVAMRAFVKGQMDLFPERSFWPDANSTLRLSYGHVEGSSPRDGVEYEPFTTVRGIMEKYVPGDAEFDLPPKFLELFARKDFAPYGSSEDMPVCFTSSLHTTGGNSGSPVLNGRGQLIGLNFDRTWESTMSDIQFDAAKCRSIALDVRYLLFVVDKVCGGERLVKEMNLVHHADEPHVIDLPIHR